MNRLVRGIFWFGLYLALVLTPLASALVTDPIDSWRPFRIELGAALGFVAFALFAAELALVARIRRASEPFGTDALMLFHRQMALAALVLVLVHVALLVERSSLRALYHSFTLGDAGRAGTVGLLAILLLAATSVWRRAWRLPYEPWLFLHRSLSVVLIGAMLAHVLAVDAYASAPLVSGVLVAFAALFLTLLLHYRVVRPLLLWRRPWIVVVNRDEGADTRTLVVEPTGHPGFAFAPGQFAWLITGRTPLFAQQHPISIASSAEPGPDLRLELSIKALGNWSGRRVPRIAPGARVWLDGPFGAFTPDREPGQGFVLIAGGVGITPMRSILLTMRDRADTRPVVLFYAAHDPSRTIWADELAALERTLNLELVHVYEDPPPGAPGERGFVTTELLGRRLPRAYRHFQFFVCGPGPMMDALERSLIELEVPSAHVQTERFDMV